VADRLPEALRLIAKNYYGVKGRWAYDAFEFVNATCFAGELPWPKIDWEITPHGKCLGATRVRGEPVIALHPTLLGAMPREQTGRRDEFPWEISPDLLGTCFAFDVLLHECMHVSVEYRLGGWQGQGSNSHNNDVWVAEVNRIAPLIGLAGVRAGRSRSRREPDESLPRTKTGKVATRVVRRSDGNVPPKAVATFPYGVRLVQGQAAAYYRAGVSPLDREGLVTGNCALQDNQYGEKTR
jgi:hypothetical protein